MSREELVVKGRKIDCPICGCDKFTKRNGVLPSRGLAIFDMEWANRGVEQYICEECHYILSFAQ